MTTRPICPRCHQPIIMQTQRMTGPAPIVWRCHCGEVLGVISEGRFYWRQQTRKGLREGSGPLPTEQTCVCGARHHWPPLGKPAY